VGLQLAGVTVPLGANLSKVWQQLQDVRKKQQDRLEESPDSDAGMAVRAGCFLVCTVTCLRCAVRVRALWRFDLCRLCNA
jgi:hypothetical protein